MQILALTKIKLLEFITNLEYFYNMHRDIILNATVNQVNSTHIYSKKLIQLNMIGNYI